MDGLLITCFEAFGGRKSNRSARVAGRVAALAARHGAEATVETLPVVFAALAAHVVRVVRSARYSGVVMLGEYNSGPGLRLETTAVNELRSPRADNRGVVASGQPVVPGGPAELRAANDVPALVARLHAEGLPAFVSRDAGRYACNQAYYLALRHCSETPVLFVHLPRRYNPAGVHDSAMPAGYAASAPRDAGPRPARLTLDALARGVWLCAAEIARPVP